MGYNFLTKVIRRILNEQTLFSKKINELDNKIGEVTSNKEVMFKEMQDRILKLEERCNESTK